MIRFETWAELEARVEIEDIRNAFGGAWVQRDHGSAARWEYVDTPKSAFYIRAQDEQTDNPIGNSQRDDYWPDEPWGPHLEGNEGKIKPARSAEAVRDDGTQGLSLRNSTRQTPRNVRQRSPGLLQQARDVGHSNKEIG